MRATDLTLTVCDATGFAAWETRFMALYLEAFTSGSYHGHYLDEAAERAWLRRLFAQHRARCYLLHEGTTLAGFLLMADAAYDRKLPADMRQQLAGQQVWALAELAVAPAYQRQGLAARLLAQCLADCIALPRDDEAASCGTTLIVRTQADALGAHRLYERYGFAWWGEVQVPVAVLQPEGLRWRQVSKHYYRCAMVRLECVV